MRPCQRQDRLLSWASVWRRNRLQSSSHRPATSALQSSAPAAVPHIPVMPQRPPAVAPSEPHLSTAAAHACSCGDQHLRPSRRYRCAAGAATACPLATWHAALPAPGPPAQLGLGVASQSPAVRRPIGPATSALQSSAPAAVPHIPVMPQRPPAVAPSEPHLSTAAAHAAPAATSTCVPRAATAAPPEPRPPAL